MSRWTVLVLGAEAVVTAALCAGLIVAAPRVMRRQRRRYGCGE
jgi:hypothetical protein